MKRNEEVSVKTLDKIRALALEAQAALNDLIVEIESSDLIETLEGARDALETLERAYEAATRAEEDVSALDEDWSEIALRGLP